VPLEVTTSLLKAAMAAPSASNRRPWEFVVVTDRGQLARLQRWLLLGRYHGPQAIVVCGNMRRAYPPPARDFWVEDCSAASQNILLAATGLGLGSVWIGIYPLKPLCAAVRRILQLPRQVVPLGMIWVGYPAEQKAPRSQYDPQRVHWERFGEEGPGGGTKEGSSCP
jgi:nitroreductase